MALNEYAAFDPIFWLQYKYPPPLTLPSFHTTNSGAATPTATAFLRSGKRRTLMHPSTPASPLPVAP